MQFAESFFLHKTVFIYKSFEESQIIAKLQSWMC